MTALSQPSSQPKNAPLAVRFPAAVIVASALAIAVNSGIAAVAHAAGASDDFRPLHVATFAGLTIVGVIGGAIGWSLIRARAAQPGALLTRLVPVVLLLSFIPDIALGISKSQAGTTWGAVAALMVMHLAVAAIAVTTYATLLPVRSAGTARR